MDTSNLFLRPGTILIMVFIAAFGLGVFSWASDAIDSSNQQALEDQRSAIDCSTLDIDVVELNAGEDSVKVFFQTNKNIENIAVELEGDTNVTRTIGSMDAGELESVSANMTGFSEASFKVQGCGQVFTE